MTTAVTVDQLRNLTDRAAHGLTPDEQARLRDGIDQLYAELEHARAEANRYAEAESADIAAGSYAGRVEELEDLAEQHARNTLTVARERDSYRAAWKEEQRRRATAEAAGGRVRRLAARIRRGVPWAANFDNLADRILAALDDRPADDTQPTRHVHVTIRHPDEYTANRAALSLVDWIGDQFPAHHVTTDAREWEQPAPG